MGKLLIIVRGLEQRRKQLRDELEKIDAAVAALHKLASGKSLLPNQAGSRTMSAAARRRIAAAQRARWAQWRAKQAKKAA